MTGTRGLVFASLIIILLLGIVLQLYFLSTKIDEKCHVVVMKEEAPVVATPSATVIPTVAPKVFRAMPTIIPTRIP